MQAYTKNSNAQTEIMNKNKKTKTTNNTQENGVNMKRTTNPRKYATK